MVFSVRMESHNGHNGTGNANNQNKPGTGHANNMNHAMSPFLISGTTGFFVLFEGAFINSTGGFVGALFLSGLFALVATVMTQLARVYETRALAKNSLAKWIGAILYGFRQALHYFAMLIVMTMNIWLIIAVVVGHGLGWVVYALVLHKKVGGIIPLDNAALAGVAANAKGGIGCDCWGEAAPLLPRQAGTTCQRCGATLWALGHKFVGLSRLKWFIAMPPLFFAARYYRSIRVCLYGRTSVIVHYCRKILWKFEKGDESLVDSTHHKWAFFSWHSYPMLSGMQKSKGSVELNFGAGSIQSSNCFLS